MENTLWMVQEVNTHFILDATKHTTDFCSAVPGQTTQGTHTRARAHTQTDRQTDRHTHTHTHKHTHTHTQTHTHLTLVPC